jgi:hypothetical protein
MPHNITLVPTKQVRFHTLHNKPTLSGFRCFVCFKLYERYQRTLQLSSLLNKMTTVSSNSQHSNSAFTRSPTPMLKCTLAKLAVTYPHGYRTRQNQMTRCSPIFGIGHNSIKFDKIDGLANIHICRSCVIREAIQTVTHPHNFKRRDRCKLSEVCSQIFSSELSS